MVKAIFFILYILILKKNSNILIRYQETNFVKDLLTKKLRIIKLIDPLKQVIRLGVTVISEKQIEGQ